MKEQNATNEDNLGQTIQEASKQLSVPENTLRKYLAYFEVKVEKSGRKNYLLLESMECLTQIVQLKSNGWSLKQIKEFMNNEAKNNKAEKTELILEAKVPDNSEVVEPVSQEVQLEEHEVNDIEGEVYQEDEAETEQNNNDDVYSSQTPRMEDESDFEENDSSLPLEENQYQQSFKGIDEDEQIEEPTKILLRDDELDASNISEVAEEAMDDNEDQSEDSSSESRSSFSKRVNLTKDSVNKEIANQAKRASRLYRFLGSRNSPRDTAEIKADLDRRVIFLNGLRYIRDNWLDRPSHEGNKGKVTSGAN